MGILESLFGGGDSDPYALYGDLFTPQQKAALQARDQSQGLLRMAGAFAKAGMPSRLPVPMGAVLGSAAEALGTSSDENVQNAMRAMLYGAQAKKLQTEQQFLKDFAASQPDFMKTVAGILATGAAAPTAPIATPSATPAGPLAAPAPAAAAGTGPLAPAAAITPASFDGTAGPLAAAIPPARAAAPPWASDPAGRGLLSAVGVDPAAQQQALELFKREAFGGDTPAATPSDTPSSPGPDVVLPSGTSRPTLPTRSIADTGGGPLAPPTAPAADPRAAQMQALMLAIAQRRAMAVLGGIKDPYGPLMDAITESPAFKGLVTGAQEAAKFPYAGPTAGSVRNAQQPYILEEQAKGKALDRINDLFKQGGLWDPKLGIIPTPGYDRLQQINEEAKARGSKAFDTTTALRQGPGGPYEAPVPVTDYADELRRGTVAAPTPIPGSTMVPGGAGGVITPGGAAAGSAPAVSGPPIGGLVGKPYYTPEELEWQKGDLKLFEDKRKGAEAAQMSIQSANEMRNLIEKGVVAGSYADERTRLLRLGQLLKLTGKDDNDLVRNTEAYIAEAGRNLKKGLEGLGPPVSNVDLQIAGAIAGNQNLTTAGMLKLMEIQEKYSRQSLTNFNNMATTAPPGRYSRAVLEPPTYGAATITGPGGQRMWNKGGQWVPY
jgi:hypothetical protein